MKDSRHETERRNRSIVSAAFFETQDGRKSTTRITEKGMSFCSSRMDVLVEILEGERTGSG